MDFLELLKQKIKRIDERQSIKTSVKLYNLVKYKDGARRVIGWGLYHDDAIRLQRVAGKIRRAESYDDLGKTIFEMIDIRIEQN